MQNINKFIFIIPVLTVLLFLFSCTEQPSITEPALTLTNTLLPPVTTTVPSLPASTVTSLPLAPPPTLTGISTLSPEKAYLALEDFLKDGCELPCWAEITPGKTLLIDASRTMSSFRSISDWSSLSEQGGQIGLVYAKDKTEIDMFVSLLSSKDEDHVQLLNITTQAFRNIGEGNYQSAYDAQLFHDLLGAYSLQNILATYGKPYEIYMTVDLYEYEPNAPDYVMWWFMYPQKGFIVKFTAKADISDGIIHACPSKTIIDLWLFAPYNDDKYKKDLLPLDVGLGYVLPTPSIHTKLISDGVGMTLDEFYQVFSQPTNQCLETPRNNWAGF